MKSTGPNTSLAAKSDLEPWPTGTGSRNDRATKRLWVSAVWLGDGVLLMSHTHVGHDCTLGDRVVLASGAALAGHVRVGDGAQVSGHSGVHQKVSIGAGAFGDPRAAAVSHVDATVVRDACADASGSVASLCYAHCSRTRPGAPATGPALTVVPVVALEPGAVLAVQLVAYDLARLETDLWVDAK